jgi:hypothetical protein
VHGSGDPYTAAFPFYHSRLGILDRPVKPGDDDWECGQISRPSLRAERRNPSRREERMDCFVAALLAMTWLKFHTYLSVPAALGARGFASFVRASDNRGRRECRVPMHPQPRVQCEMAHECSHHRYTGIDPAFPAQWFYGLCRALPGDEFLLSPSSAD